MRLRLAIAVAVLAAGALSGATSSPACEQCHADIARNFRKTGMARSFYRLTPQNVVENFQSGNPFHHEASDSFFSMFERGGKYYQRRWQVGFDGHEANIDEKQIDFVLGSGNHARTYLHLTSRNTLQQLPLGWYAEKGGYWDMNPGYDAADHHGSTRIIHYECMFCHNAYPRIPKGHEEPGAEAQYLQPLPEGIDCQRCHGPGKRHMEAAGKPGAKRDEIRSAIVNPARLSPEREMEVCMECHLETTSRLLPQSIQRLDRGPFSYVPGQSLADFKLLFDRIPGRNKDFEVAGAAYRLRGSACFLKSAGKLRCTTCHDPHNIPRGDAALQHYNGVCSTCHAAGALKPACLHSTNANCVGCHMPRRRTDDAVHIVMTDHRIARRPPPGDLLAAKKEIHESPATSYRGEVVLYYPERPSETVENTLYIALAQVKDQANLKSGLPQLEGMIQKHRPAQAGFYTGLAEAYLAAGENTKAISFFEEAVRRAPASEIAILELGNALLESRQWKKAESALRRAKALWPDDAAAWGLLGRALWLQDKKQDARNALEAALKLDPETPEPHNYLASLFMGVGDPIAAEREFRAAIRINPGIADWQSNLAGLKGSRGEIAEARYLFEQSIRINPDYAPARLNFARLLANTDRPADAEKQARAAIQADPGLAAAHELLGSLLSARGDMQGAEGALQSALRLAPNSGRAHYELGLLLGRTGNASGALEQLRIAARSSDAEVRSAALQVLRSLGQY